MQSEPILDEVGRRFPSPIWGMTSTDERAFLALGARGLSVLARPNGAKLRQPCLDQAAGRLAGVSDTMAASMS